MKFFGKAIAMSIIGLGAATAAQADTIATWTFENTVPATAGNFAPEIGAGSALGSHASGASVYSSPAGNGSAHSFSSNTWAVGDYYQFSVSTAGFNNIALSWDQTGSSTGPKSFKLAYSTNGTTFTDFANYTVLGNVWSSGANTAGSTFTEDLSSVAALYNQANVYFRLVDTSTASINGGTVAATGTGRVDNFTVNGTAVAPVPVPAAIWLLGSGLMGLGGLSRRRSV